MVDGGGDGMRMRMKMGMREQREVGTKKKIRIYVECADKFPDNLATRVIASAIYAEP